MTAMLSRQENVPIPPRGGADLECLLSCRGFSASSVRRSVEACQRNGFNLIEGDAILLYEEDPVEPVRVANRDQLPELLATLRPEDLSASLIKLHGRLAQCLTPLSLVFRFRDGVLVMSIPEDALWEPDLPPEAADLQRLRRFGAICRDVAEQVGALLAVIGTEAIHPEEMRLDVAKASGALPPAEALSEESLRALREWYTRVYVRRWQSES